MLALAISVKNDERKIGIQAVSLSNEVNELADVLAG